MIVCSSCLLVFVGLTGSFSWHAGTEMKLHTLELLGGFRESWYFNLGQFVCDKGIGVAQRRKE